MATVQLEGLDELLKTLTALQRKDVYQRAVAVVAARAKELLVEYPNSTRANSPPSKNGAWYQRGYGMRYRRLDGRITGAQNVRDFGAQVDHETIWHARGHWQ